MALMSCPDCGNEVSTQAMSCPKCGRQLRLPKKAFSKLGCFTILVLLFVLACALKLFGCPAIRIW